MKIAMIALLLFVAGCAGTKTIVTLEQPFDRRPSIKVSVVVPSHLGEHYHGQDD